MRRALVGIAAVAALAALSSPAQALPVVFSGSSGTLAASVSFDVVAGNLQVTLTNTSANDALVPADVLAAIFFDISGANETLSPLSATIDAGSLVYGGTCNPGPCDGTTTDVGGEWEYGFTDGGLAGSLAQEYGISSVGFSIGAFTGPNFGGPNLDDPPAIDGGNFGILPTGDNNATANGGLENDPLIQDSVVFLLDVADDFDLSRIGNVRFQYGTDLGEPSFGSGGGSGGGSGQGGGGGGGSTAPEPATLALFGLALAAGARRLRRK